MIFNKILILTILNTFLIQYVYSIELTSTDVSVIRIGIVDMDRILENYSIAQKAQENIISFKEAKMSTLAEIEKEIDDLMKKRISLNTEIEQLQVQIDKIVISQQKSLELTSQSTESYIQKDVEQDSEITKQNIEESIKQLKNDIEVKQKNFDEVSKTIDEKKEMLKIKKQEIEYEILKYKEKLEAEIFAQLYSIIEKVANKEKLNLVIDKTAILFGVSEIDITDKVLKMLK